MYIYNYRYKNCVKLKLKYCNLNVPQILLETDREMDWLGVIASPMK